MRLFLFLLLGAMPMAHSASASDAVALNTAGQEVLSSIDGIGEHLAKGIISYRDSHGGISSLDALRVLPGFTPQAMLALQEKTTLGVVFTVDTGGVKKYNSVEDVLKSFGHEPKVNEVQRWTNSYAKTSPEMVESWLRASKGFAAVPRLRLEYRLVDGWDQDFIYELGEGSELLPVKDDAGNDRENRILVRADWDLSELVMSSDRIRVINEAQDVVKLRDKLLTQVTRLYFERRRHQVEMLLNPREDLAGKVEDELRLMELTAGIDGLTGGKFSAGLSR
jgi:hypothetical protein